MPSPIVPDADAQFDESDIPPSTGKNHDVDEAMRLLMWARVCGFEIPEVRIGSVVMSVRDLRPRRTLNDGPPGGERRRTIWEENGLSPEDIPQ